MRVCVFGAGAIGGLIGARLAQAGSDVTLIARGAHLAAMKRSGLRILSGGDEAVVHPRCTDDPEEVGAQDHVIVTLKAHAVPAVVDSLQPLLGERTAVVTAMNGIPWWYFYKLEGPWQDRRLESVDPGGRQWDGIGPERAIGCVLFQACEMVEPGVIRHTYGDRLILGEPDGRRSERALALSKVLIAAGFRAPVRPRIRDEIWVKLWGNVAFNPVSVLTHGTLAAIAGDPGTRALCRIIMLEAQAVAEKLGVQFPLDVDARIEGTAEVGEHRTSMLQDLERGRPMEIDPIVTVVQEMGRVVGVETPCLDAILALVRQRAREAGCYPA
jgi:2-dehydropantoate 2-reductase